MPQELHVVRCFSCKTFQVQIVKKVPKWQCKMCNEKQSVLKVYAQGSGKDCRQYVQDLNMQQGLALQETSDTNGTMSFVEAENFQPAEGDMSIHNNIKSKWDDYLTNEESNTEIEQKPDDTWENQNVEFPRTHPPRGKKRKLTHQNQYFEGDVGCEESCQPKSRAVPNSSHGPCASDTLKSGNVKQRGEEYQTSPCRSSAASNSSGSKWSQFVSQSEKSLSSGSLFDSAGDYHVDDGGSSPFTGAFGMTPISRASPCESESFSCKSHSVGKAEQGKSTKNKNPFRTSDEDNLDILLDF